MRTLPRYALLSLAAMAFAVASLPASAAPSASPAPASPAPASPAPTAPARVAATAAAATLAAFVPPVGAVQVPAAPAPALVTAPARPGRLNLVTRTGFWLAQGRPAAVLAWIEAHQPSGLTQAGTGELTRRHQVVLSFAEFSGQLVPGVLVRRTLLVSVAPAIAGTGIRADAQVTWMPAKPAAERIPAAAREITVTLLDGPGLGSNHTEQITDAATVDRIRAIADGLPLVPPGLTHCPADLGRQVEFVFRGSRTGPALATVVANSGGCGTAVVTIGDRPYPPLWHAGLLTDAVTAAAVPHGA